MLIPLQNTTQQPVLAELTNRAMREKMFDNSWTRTEKGDANDTRATITELAKLRAEKAKLLGYPNYAAYVLYNQMAKTPDAVREIHRPARAADRRQRPPTRPSRSRRRSTRTASISSCKPWDWETLFRQGAQGEIRSRPERAEALFRAQPRAARTACSMPPTSSTASPSRNATTFRSISRMCACSPSMTRTARSSACSIAIISSATTNRAAPG